MRHSFRIWVLCFFSGTSLAFGMEALPFAGGFLIFTLLLLWKRFSRAALFGAVFLLAGFFWSAFLLRTYAVKQTQVPTDARVDITATILREVEQRRKTQQVVAGSMTFDGQPVPGQVIVRLPLLPRVRIFDRITFDCRFELPEPIETDGRIFRYDWFLAGQGVHAVCPFPKNVAALGRDADFREPLFAAKRAFIQTLGRIFPEPEAGLLTGLLLGRASAQETSIREDFAYAGLSHIIAVSGWNITMVMLLLESVLLTVLPRRRAFPLVLAAIGVYVLLVGLEGSVLRAAIMGSIVAYGRTRGQRGDTINILLFAGFLMVMIKPYWLLFDVGFQLSMLATLGLILTSTPISERLRFFPDRFAMRETAAASMVAIVFTLPISVYVFGSLPVYSLFANLLVVPLLPYASLAGATAVLAGMLLFPAGMFLARVPEGILLFITRIAEGFHELPFARIVVPAISGWVLVALYVLPVAYFMMRRRAHA